MIDMSDFLADIPEAQNSLCHHGIKGQKWGVCNGPPYPIKPSYKFRSKTYEEVTKKKYNPSIDKKLNAKNVKPTQLAKGSLVRHVTTNKDFAEDLNYPGSESKRLFVSYADIDRKHYEGFFSAWQRSKGKSVYLAEMELKKDLNIANRNDMKKEFDALFQNDEFKKVLSKDVARYLKKFDDDYGSDVSGNRKFVRDASSKEDVNRIFQWFNAYGPYEYGKSWDQYMNRIEKKYDAIEDINDSHKGGMMASFHPLVILNTLESIGNVKVSEITDDKILETLNSL